MDYTINKTRLRALIDEEVSKVADEAYGDAGVPLYDSVVLTEKDDAWVDWLLDGAVNAFAARTYDICKFAENDTLGNSGLVFYVPDFDDTMEDAVRTEITHWLVFATCAEIFQSRRAQAVPEYNARALAAIDKAVTLLKSRRNPADIW